VIRFRGPLTPGVLTLRYKRFLADVVLADGRAVTAHVANPGAMTGLAEPGLDVWLSHHPGTARKLEWSWELCRIGNQLVGVNTLHANAVAAEAISLGQVAELAGYHDIRREVAYGRRSRIDLLLSTPGRPKCYVEVKTVNLKRNDAACFPDAVTARGSRHLEELTEMVAAGHRAVMVFLVQRGDCSHFAPAGDIDPVYARGLDKALAAGVEALCYSCRLTLEGIALDRPLPLVLAGTTLLDERP